MTADESPDDSEAAPTSSADEDYVFDPETTEMRLTARHGVSKFDVKDMAKMDVLTVELEERDGETVVTECTLDVTAMASVIGELDVVERKMGDDWRETSWNPRVRMKYVK